MTTSKPFTKVTYQTPEGKTFKTIAPVSEMCAFDYMRAKYSNEINILNMRPSVKSKYKKFSNVSR